MTKSKTRNEEATLSGHPSIETGTRDTFKEKKEQTLSFQIERLNQPQIGSANLS